MLAKEDLDLNEYNVRPGSFFELPCRLCGGGNGDDARVDATTSLSTNQGSERDIGALEGNLPEGDPPERIRTALNSASPQSEQDHRGDGQETEAEPEPENEADTTNAARKPSPVQRAVSLRWLQKFAAQYLMTIS